MGMGNDQLSLNQFGRPLVYPLALVHYFNFSPLFVAAGTSRNAKISLGKKSSKSSDEKVCADDIQFLVDFVGFLTQRIKDPLPSSISSSFLACKTRMSKQLYIMVNRGRIITMVTNHESTPSVPAPASSFYDSRFRDKRCGRCRQHFILINLQITLHHTLNDFVYTSVFPKIYG
ncbi:hypothetical protein LOAG_05942 [Loa loa]|uniref:Uncharacterized protein n=1 Tax=Loa loa TaxID=7209 RepID=A0A1S0TYU0_LOALO|nr:hypothetical protein LOAG_05942 [Loa loa]EFO22547.1 hypothetical protein LOAG_05942 [Loa loa]